MTHRRTRLAGRNLLLAIAAAALFAGCGSHSPGEGAPGQTPAKTVARKPVSPADVLSKNMVSAVALTKPSTLPIQVKFELHDRPDVGQPVDVDLAIVPMSASVDRVSGKVEGEDGLELIEGEEIPATDRPTEGVPIRHSVKVVPRHDGIFTVRVVVTVDASGVSSTDSYLMPVIANAAPAATGAVSAAAPARVSEAHTTKPGAAAAQ